MAKLQSSPKTTPSPVISITEQAQLADVIRGALQQHESHGTSDALFPRGGNTMPTYGCSPSRTGSVLDLTGLNRLVDYPARDMTITVEAGFGIARLAETLAKEGQRLPVDVPRANQATLGGAIAVNVSGPRRYSQGTLRDYVIGISAVDGRGVLFKGGGRVVKNVAGYDLCKLLIGSLGTLAVISQVTLKVKPKIEASAFVVCDLPTWDKADSLLASLVQSSTTPTAIEVLAGPAWQNDLALGTHSQAAVGRLAVGLEGTRDEVAWMVPQLRAEWQKQQVESRVVADDQVTGLWDRLTEFAIPQNTQDAQNAASADGPFVIKANVLPSETAKFAGALLAAVPNSSLQAHAGNGIVKAHLPAMQGHEAAKLMIQRIGPLASSSSGNAVVISYPAGAELPRGALWGAAPSGIASMRAVKEQFDPHDILNPGRFVY